MTRLALLLCALSGCSVIFSSSAGDVSSPDGGAADSTDGGTADSETPNIPLGIYSITFDLTGGCSTSQFAADTLTVTAEGFEFSSESCPEMEVVASLPGEGLELWSCDRALRYEVEPFTFDDLEAPILADQYIPPSTNIICTGEFLLVAEKGKAARVALACLIKKGSPKGAPGKELTQ